MCPRHWAGADMAGLLKQTFMKPALLNKDSTGHVSQPVYLIPLPKHEARHLLSALGPSLALMQAP